MSLRKVVGMIRGPKGEPVLLTVLSADQGIGGVPVIIDIVRDKVELTEKDARSEIRRIQVPDPTGAERSVDVLYVYLPSFYSDFAGRKNGDEDFKSSTKDVARLIDTAVAEEQIGGVVLDLRGNGGGSLDEAVALSGLFFDQGPVVQIREPGRVVQRDDPEPGTHYDGPLVVMIDRLSASASEIVAAALKDYGRAVLVGEGATHGKGTVQTIFDLDRAFRGASLFRDQPPGSLKLTIAKFYRVTGGSTQKRGVSPHIALSSFTDYMELGEEHLPHVMPWDQIDALDVSSEVDVSPLVPTVIERSAARLAADREYQALVAEIEAYGERRQRKTVSLNRERRLEERDVERALSERLDELMTRGRAYAEDEAAQSDDESRDFLLQEGLSVLADLIELETASQNAVPEPGAEVGARSPQAVTDPATVRDRAAE
jgi:carboxyl-terminal processing protease